MFKISTTIYIHKIDAHHSKAEALKAAPRPTVTNGARTYLEVSRQRWTAQRSKFHQSKLPFRAARVNLLSLTSRLQGNVAPHKCATKISPTHYDKLKNCSISATSSAECACYNINIRTTFISNTSFAFAFFNFTAVDMVPSRGVPNPGAVRASKLCYPVVRPWTNTWDPRNRGET